MSKGLLIAEKASLKREIEQVYNKIKSALPYELDFIELHGHIMRLLLPSEMDDTQKSRSWENLPFHPEEHGGWQYVPIEEKKTGNFMTSKERLADIKKRLASGEYDFIINAGDPDQEGELLVQEPLRYLKNTLPVKRFWTNALTESEITKALNNLMDDDHDPMLVHLYDAALARQHSDYRYGMNLSSAASLSMKRSIAVGRVMTPILAIVCRRELEIQNFVPKTVYGVKLIYARGFEGVLYNPKTSSDDEGDKDNAGIVWFDTQAEADAMIQSLGNTATVVSIETKHEKTYAPKLYKLATIQTEAGKRGFKADDVLNIIQGLYEKKYLSYPRTDCEYLSSTEDFISFIKTAKNVAEQAEKMAPTANASLSRDFNAMAAMLPLIKSITANDIAYVKKSSKWVNDKELESSGHSALRPTEDAPNLASLSSSELIIYSMIVRRYVAIFCPPMEADKTMILTENNSQTFRSSGKVITNQGYSVILGAGGNDTILPAVTKGEVLDVSEKQRNEKTSTCPTRYSDGELIAACENPLKFLNDEALKHLGKELKIGTPATRASIINQKLIGKNQYMEHFKDGKIERIRPTGLGMAIIANLDGYEICKVDMTGLWEEKLQMVRNGALTLESLESEMQKNVAKQIDDMKGLVIKVIVPADPAHAWGVPICKCPICGKDIVTGRSSYYCLGYKDETCTVGVQQEILKAKITADDAVKLFTGTSITKKMAKDGRSWEQELAFDNDEKKVVFVQQKEAVTPYTCPKCKKEKLVGAKEKVACSCGFTQWRTVAHKRLSDKEWDDLLTKHKTGEIQGMQGKSGKTFKAKLVINDDGVLNFEFAPAKTKK